MVLPPPLTVPLLSREEEPADEVRVGKTCSFVAEGAEEVASSAENDGRPSCSFDCCCCGLGSEFVVVGMAFSNSSKKI